MKELEKAKREIEKGGGIVLPSFKLGFMSCIESIKDKGCFELSAILREEHKKIS